MEIGNQIHGFQARPSFIVSTLYSARPNYYNTGLYQGHN